MALNGLLAERELFRDIAGRAAFHDAAHHLEFTRRQAVRFALRSGGLLHQVVERRDKIDYALSANPIIAGIHGANRGLEMARESILKNDSARTNMQCLNDLLG